jgi:hypothetical protein
MKIIMASLILATLSGCVTRPTCSPEDSACIADLRQRRAMAIMIMGGGIQNALNTRAQFQSVPAFTPIPYIPPMKPLTTNCNTFNGQVTCSTY